MITEGEREYRPRHLAPDEDGDASGYPPADVADAPEPAAPADRRVDRFVAHHGWRAYALPALTLLAIVALVVALASTPETPSSAQPQRSSAAPSTGPSAAPSPVPPTSVAPAAAEPTPGYVQAGDNTLSVVPGSSAVLGTGGPVHTFDVEVEGGIGVDGAQFAAQVEKILGDARSWGAGGAMSFQRVSDGTADLHVSLVSPQHVEGYCPGYQTNGYTSCRYGDRVVINLARWSVGVDDYDGHLGEYREYVVNHEVGHFLGHQHVDCPAAGQKAPVMMQQTLDVGDCVINAWPYPNGPGGDPNAPA